MFFFFQAEDGIRDLVRSRGLGDVYKRQLLYSVLDQTEETIKNVAFKFIDERNFMQALVRSVCLLYTSDAADERSSVDLGGRRIIKKKTNETCGGIHTLNTKTVITMHEINKPQRRDKKEGTI